MNSESKDIFKCNDSEVNEGFEVDQFNSVNPTQIDITIKDNQTLPQTSLLDEIMEKGGYNCETYKHILFNILFNILSCIVEMIVSSFFQ